VDTLFFMLRWARCRFHKKRDGTRYAELVFLHLVGSAGHVVHNNASGVRIVDALIFHACVGLVQFPQKARRDRLSRTCVFHPVGSVGLIVHLVRSGRETSSHYFSCSRETGMPNFCFYIQWDLRVM
jgi:hypothetical protein